MGALLQKILLRVLPSSQSNDSSPEREVEQHVTAFGCCSTIRIDENVHHDKDTTSEDDSSDLG